MHTVDINTAYLNARLTRPVSARAPKHMTGVEPGTTATLNAAVDGLALRVRQGMVRSSQSILHRGMLSESIGERPDPALSMKGRTRENMIMVAVKVDAMTIAGPS